MDDIHTLLWKQKGEGRLEDSKTTAKKDFIPNMLISMGYDILRAEDIHTVSPFITFHLNVLILITFCRVFFHGQY